MGSLLGNLKRITASSRQRPHCAVTSSSWLDGSTRPHRKTPTYCSPRHSGLYAARHLGVPLDDDVAEAVPAIASWWQSPVASVPVSIRERGDRNPRGHTVRAAELRGAKTAPSLRPPSGGRTTGDRLRGARRCRRASGRGPPVIGRELGAARATGHRRLDDGPGLTTSSAALVDHPARLWVRPAESDLTLHGEDGDLIVHRLDVVVTSGTRPVWGRDDAELANEGHGMSRRNAISDDDGRKDAARLLLNTSSTCQYRPRSSSPHQASQRRTRAVVSEPSRIPLGSRAPLREALQGRARTDREPTASTFGIRHAVHASLRTPTWHWLALCS